MKQKSFHTITLLLVIFTFFACQKDPDTKNDPTIENLSGTYGLKALVWTSGGMTINVYDQLDPCEKDNLIKLNVDKTANFMDAGVACSPAENENGTWYISHDSLYYSNSTEGAKITSFDGKTLVLTGHPDNEPTVIGTTTLEKK
jgi:hypothetical protein